MKFKAGDWVSCKFDCVYNHGVIDDTVFGFGKYVSDQETTNFKEYDCQVKILFTNSKGWNYDKIGHFRKKQTIKIKYDKLYRLVFNEVGQDVFLQENSIAP